MNDPDVIPAPPVAQPDADFAMVPPSEPAPIRRPPWWIAALAGFVILAVGEIWLFNAADHNADQATRVAALSRQVNRLHTELSAVASQTHALAARPIPKPAPAAAPAPPPPAIPASLAQKLTSMQASIAALSSTTLADHATVTALQGNAATVPKLVAKARMLATVAQASLALQNGAPLGNIPNAPAALARYQTKAPPTLAALQASFPGFARKASAAGGSVVPKGGFWRTVKGRVESLITIRHHDKVLVGSRAAGTLDHAETLLDQGNLPGAVAALKSLPTSAQSTMAPWTAQANHLLAARAALTTMAEAH